MKILGVSAFGDASAAALVRDGVVVAAAEEERFTRRRRDAALPRRAVRFCLARAGLTPGDLDQLVFYEKPMRRFERVLVSQLRAFPRSGLTFSKNLFHWLGDRLWIQGELSAEFGVAPSRILFCEHQMSHAASAFLTSPFEESAVLVADGAGEWATTSLARARGTEIEMLAEVEFPHSLGLLASAVTQYLGFEPGADESKIAALAAWGEPRYAESFAKLVRISEDGSFDLDRTAFRFEFDDARLYDKRLEELFGPPRLSSDRVRFTGDDTRDADVAASLQSVLEGALLALARELHRRVPSENLCLAGRLAENVAANARLLRDGPFRRLHVARAPGDGGGALGAALYAAHALHGIPRPGAGSGADPGEELLEAPATGARRVADTSALLDEVVGHLAAGRIVGWLQGRFEWGPRSLGRRSVLADPRDERTRERLLRGVKRREAFVPFAPSLPEEEAARYFDVPAGAAEPARAMQIVLAAKDAAREHAPAALLRGAAARPQLVRAADDPLFHELLVRFGAARGAPLLLNTSLNLRGHPIARGEADGLAFFERTELDLLVAGDRIYARS